MKPSGLFRRSQALRNFAGSAVHRWGRLMLHTEQLHEFDRKEAQFQSVSESEPPGVTLCGTAEDAASVPEKGLAGPGARSNMAGAWAPHSSARPLVQQQKAPHSARYARCLHFQVTRIMGQQTHILSARAECRTFSTDGDVDIRGKVGQNSWVPRFPIETAQVLLGL
jgi:hypothetical protein